MIMHNIRMREGLYRGTILDVRTEGQETGTGTFRLDRFVDGVDYCDAQNEAWIWSIGRRYSDGVYIASTRADLYQNPDYKCVFLR